MTIREKIQTMEAFERGEEIEETYTHQKEKEWLPNKNPSWDWCRCTYRIKPKPKQVVVIEKWLIRDCLDIETTVEINAEQLDFFLTESNSNKVKLLDTYEVEL